MKIMPFLKSDEVHIWSARLPDNERNIPYFTSVLSKDENQKANSFRFPKDQKNFIVSRGILKCLLGRYLEYDPQEVEIVYGLCGKPYLIEQTLFFNLSHSRDYVLYAVTLKNEVGIDLEYIDETLATEDMALNILASYELSYWKNVKPEERIDTFFKFWVCKEAYLKASGKGWLSDQQEVLLEGIDLFMNNVTDKSKKASEKMRAPYFFGFIPGYASAFFIDGPPLRPFHFDWKLRTQTVL